jgi:hypothetical protein
MDCVICQADFEEQGKVWHAYANKLRLRDALRIAQRTWPEAGLTSEMVRAHLREHHYIQPSPAGTLDRGLALQEALTTFPRSWYYLMLALYRGQALSRDQIYRMFYLDHADNSDQLREKLLSDLQRLAFRSFLYQVWPDTISTLRFEDPGPYYFLNRQAIPLVERLEGLETNSLPFGMYVTSQQQVQEFYLERDARFLDVVVSMREHLYRREFEISGKPCHVHLGVEHWYAPSQLYTELDGENFAPSGMAALRVESRDGTFSTLLPVWFEYDRGTEDAEETADEILRYAKYFESEKYAQMFPLLHEHKNPGPLVIICEDAYRREEVSRILGAKLAGQDAPIYLTERSTMLHDPYAPNVLSPTADKPQRYSLIERMLAHSQALINKHVFSGTAHITDPSARELSKQSGSSNIQSAEVDLSAWGGNQED